MYQVLTRYEKYFDQKQYTLMRAFSTPSHGKKLFFIKKATPCRRFVANAPGMAQKRHQWIR